MTINPATIRFSSRPLLCLFVFCLSGICTGQVSCSIKSKTTRENGKIVLTETFDKEGIRLFQKKTPVTEEQKELIIITACIDSLLPYQQILVWAKAGKFRLIRVSTEDTKENRKTFATELSEKGEKAEALFKTFSAYTSLEELKKDSNVLLLSKKTEKILIREMKLDTAGATTVYITYDDVTGDTLEQDFYKKNIVKRKNEVELQERKYDENIHLLEESSYTVSTDWVLLKTKRELYDKQENKVKETVSDYKEDITYTAAWTYKKGLLRKYIKAEKGGSLIPKTTKTVYTYRRKKLYKKTKCDEDGTNVEETRYFHKNKVLVREILTDLGGERKTIVDYEYEYY